MFSERFEVTASSATYDPAVPNATFAEAPMYVDFINNETSAAKPAWMSFDGVTDAVKLTPTVHAHHRFYVRTGHTKIYVRGTSSPVVQIIGER
jgi:hypothetical protein